MERVTRFDVEVRESEVDGVGVFAKRDFKRGELVGIITGKLEEFADPFCPYTLVYEEDGVQFGLEPSFPFKYLNHSSKPNTNGEIVLRAIKRIKSGEELTMDYGENWSEE